MNVLKRLLTSSLFLLLAIASLAQNRAVSGRILSDDGTPLAGVTVRVKGSNRSVQTDSNGNYTISAQSGDVLQFSYVGYDANESRVGAGSVSDFRLRRTDNTLETVTVAMDIKRNPKELGFSVQKVTGAEIQETQRENFINSLQGRVAGLTITPTGGAAGASSQIVLRGFNSMALDNSPLFVIDGVIVDNSTVNESGGAAGVGASMGLASAQENRGNDYSNRLGDMNPNDIETITVLKGPEATALYGSQASSGAIVITTKRGNNTGKVSVNYDNSFRFQKLTRYPKMFTKYDSGTNGAPGDLFSFFGPEYSPDTKLYDNSPENFFRTGFAQTHNISAEYGKKNVTFRFSGSFFDQESPIPTNTYKRYTAKLTNTTKIGKLDIRPSIQFSRIQNDKPLRGTNGYLLNLLAWPADNDIRDWQSADGMKKPLYNANPNGEIDNPYYNVNKNRSGDQRDGIVGTLGLDYNPFSWLTLAGRFGYETYDAEGFTRYDSMSIFVTRALKGKQDNYYRNYYGYNHTINATFRHKIGDFSGRVMVGNMWQDYETQMYAVYGTNLSNQTSKDSNNTDPATRTRNLNAVRNQLPNFDIRRQAAYFGEVSVGYKSAIFLTYSHRFEESSIFPKDFRNYNYPAASISVMLSDLIPGIKGKTLSYLKLRGSIANTARSSGAYANQSIFIQNTGSGGGGTYGFTNSNPFLRPERQQTYEYGAEARLFNSRLNIDATYYNTENKDLIVELFRASYGTGFVLNTLNVGSNKNEGIEIAIDATPVQTNNTKWTTRLNFNRMRNQVTSLPANVPEFYVSDTWLYANARGGLVVGQPTTGITSYGYARNLNGNILVDPATGLPVLENVFKSRGDRNPDFTLGFLNNISHKNFRFSMLWDLKVGGDVFNATDRYMTGLGRSYRTEDRMTPRVVNGVLRDGFENSATPTQNNIAIIPYYNQNYYTTMPEEEFIEKDVNWFRLRDITMSYSIPTKNLSSLRFVKSMSVFVTGNDLILLTNYTGADPAVNGNTAGSRGVGAFGFDFGNVGTPISVNFGIRANF